MLVLEIWTWYQPIEEEKLEITHEYFSIFQIKVKHKRELCEERENNRHWKVLVMYGTVKNKEKSGSAEWLLCREVDIWKVKLWRRDGGAYNSRKKFIRLLNWRWKWSGELGKFSQLAMLGYSSVSTDFRPLSCRPKRDLRCLCIWNHFQPDTVRQIIY